MSVENGEALLEVNGLRTHFFTDDGAVKSVDGVSFKLMKGEVLGVVGESGCGKSVTALSIMRLIAPPGRIVEGEIKFEGKNLVALSEREMRSIRGNQISMIFQEPMTSLNPVFTVGNQIGEAIMLHQKKSRREAHDRSIELLRTVKVPAPEQRVNEYPHQLSGGMRQRVMIAMALACNPKLLIADEPTTALDVTIQAQILDLLRDLQQQFNMSIMIITHDLGVVAEISDHVAVMYASKIVEYATAKELYANPYHPYTKGLFRSRPSTVTDRKEKLKVIPGSVPNPLNLPTGCKFHPRCDLAETAGMMERCKSKEPQLREVAPGHWVSCDVVGNEVPLPGAPHETWVRPK